MGDKGGSVQWDGRAANGEQVSAGPYFFNLRVDGRTIETRKSILVK